MTRVLLISGSTREGSLHTAALRTAARFAPPEIATTRYEDLRHLPAFVPGELPMGPVAELRSLVDAADAVLFSTPEYAGSLPGSLKNLLDWLVDGGDLGGKPVAWLSVVRPGLDDGARAALESVLDHAGARLLRSACVRIPLEMASIDGAGIVTDDRLHMALQDMLQALARTLADSRPRPQPSWQAHSSVYPIVPDQGPTGRPVIWPDGFS
ncbi:NADPH-dependent FMN reductase [Actinoplanes flavus]|uniref:NAD(P)H-dependent oxidoreductase n=1 Tax=Actinoplanes flavus TaxID=2820290 RepID=A0ABS3ULQ2_9ACTN|nr:NADPH-dependent FMN reductase [Actinoplanes flavus]MBO3739718.1 NAD(P)H-dependent oxidoreductase [Actinoplanes flavus]